VRATPPAIATLIALQALGAACRTTRTLHLPLEQASLDQANAGARNREVDIVFRRDAAGAVPLVLVGDGVATAGETDAQKLKEKVAKA